MPTAEIDAYIAALPKWQAGNLTRFRDAVRRVAPAADEGWKWEVPVFLLDSRLVCSCAAFAKHTKYNFFNGAALADRAHLFNSGLESKKSRSIDLAEGASLDATALDVLIRAAFAADGSARVPS
jgi:hypothetical protein